MSYANPKPMNRHHRVAQSRGGKNSGKNIVRVREDLHRAYHMLFGTEPPEEVARILSETWIDHNMVLIAVPRNHKQFFQHLITNLTRR